jgi:hypothetical protein
MNRKIVEYDVVCELDSESLVEFVTKRINDGWQPYGPFQALQGNEGYGYMVYQAIVKYADEKQA